ncbi:MAG: RNA-binding S4 domain-containing protein [Thermoleophilia bacterium]|nr:RNA-binding S4 domain-containing protein [Thermoleophilia bacterium]
MASPPRGISVTFPVTLGQLLKLAGVVYTGGQAKQLITSGAVSVNGEVETRRGRKLAPGDRVTVGDQVFVVEAASADTA